MKDTTYYFLRKMPHGDIWTVKHQTNKRISVWYTDKYCLAEYNTESGWLVIYNMPLNDKTALRALGAFIEEVEENLFFEKERQVITYSNGYQIATMMVYNKYAVNLKTQEVMEEECYYDND